MELFIFFPSHKESRGKLVSYDFRPLQRRCPLTVNSDSMCRKAYFFQLSRKQSIQPILNILLGKIFLIFSNDHKSSAEQPFQMRTSAELMSICRYNMVLRFI